MIKAYDTESMWQEFTQTAKVTPEQVEQFKKYADLLLQWNERMNLTAITELKQIVKDHFLDSLSLGAYMDVQAKKAVCDVGAGAGFPGLPLKIKYPHLGLYVIEVNKKKLSFLEAVCETLNITATFYDLDWRTFLRKTDFDIDLFV